jgi:hypothetical protein
VYRLDAVAGSARLPYSLRALPENLLRNEDGPWGTPAQRKALMRALVASIKIYGREAIHPIFRLPVRRIMSTMVGRSLHKSNRDATLAGPIVML